MKRPPSPPDGPITRREAATLLSALLGLDPTESVYIGTWVLMRRQLLRPIEANPAKTTEAEEQWLARYGIPNPAWDNPPVIGEPLPPMYVPPPHQRGRPIERQLDRANAFLLRGHPQLAKSPFYFAMLEALFGLDSQETIRFPLPSEWKHNPTAAENRRRSVRDRARRRIARAISLVENE